MPTQLPSPAPAQKIFLIVWTKLRLSSMGLSHDLEIVYATESESDAKSQLASLRKTKQRLHIVDTILWRDPNSFSTKELLSTWESCTKSQRDSMQRLAKSPCKLHPTVESRLRDLYLLRYNPLAFATKDWEVTACVLSSIAQRMLKLVRRKKKKS